MPTTEAILTAIAAQGYTVQAGTAGYRIRLGATRDTQEHIVTEDDEHTAAMELAKLVGLALADEVR